MERRPPRIIGFKQVVSTTLLRCVGTRISLADVEALDILLTGYKDKRFRNALDKMEERFKELKSLDGTQWPRNRRPTPSHEYLRLLVELAKRKGLFDVEEGVDW